MNCAECEKEPLTPGHYCPCCGRKLSLQERRALETNSPAPRCQSCGGPSADGDLCQSCKQAFAPVLNTPPVVEPRAVEQPATEVALPPPVANLDAVKVAAAAEISKAEAAKAAAALIAKAHLERAANPPVITKRPIMTAPPPQRRNSTSVLVTAAAAIVVLAGAAEGARRLGFLWSPQETAQVIPVQAPPAATHSTPPVTRPAAASVAPAEVQVVAENRAPVIAAPTPRASALPKPKAAAVRRPPVRQASTSKPKVVPVVPLAPPIERREPVPVSSPAVVVANTPRASALPAGRFFDRNDVDVPPEVATRVAPRLPADVPARLRSGTVVVRVLVSQTGHPFRVSLLRGSGLGRPSDEAVIAAVTQWTFSPAKKRGEAVNCWFNIGVPLS